MNIDEIRNMLLKKGLKVTPQRMAVLEAIIDLQNHPEAYQIIEYIRIRYPNIATGTVYKILDVLVESNLIMRVKTDRDIMRYDAILDNHHHLYSGETKRIENYFDEKLDELLKDYFKAHQIPNFKIEDIKLQIMGAFLDKQ